MPKNISNKNEEKLKAYLTKIEQDKKATKKEEKKKP